MIRNSLEAQAFTAQLFSQSFSVRLSNGFDEGKHGHFVLKAKSFDGRIERKYYCLFKNGTPFFKYGEFAGEQTVGESINKEYLDRVLSDSSFFGIILVYPDKEIGGKVYLLNPQDALMFGIERVQHGGERVVSFDIKLLVRLNPKVEVKVGV